VMGELVIGAVLTLVGNMLADVGYALVDPRIRTG
jgi:peptide/nickel transport system permease protein